MNYINYEQEETPTIPTNDEQNLGEVPEKQNSTSPYKIISIAVIVILLGLFGYFYYSNLDKNSLNTTNNLTEIANWETYKNEEYGFEFKYPDSWIIKENIAGGNTNINSINISNYDTLDPKYYWGNIDGTTIQIQFYFNHNYETGSFPQQFTEINELTGKTNSYSKTTETDDYIIYNSDNPHDEAHYRKILSKIDNKSIGIFAWFQKENIDEIISTFKFIDETANWQTYSNEKLNFSFQYPNNWRLLSKGVHNPSGVLLSLKFETGQVGQVWGSERNEFYGLINCYPEGVETMPYLDKKLFKTQESIIISGYKTLLYENKNLTEYPGYEPVGFFIPVIKDDKMHCGIHFWSWGILNKDEKGIINSFKFIGGFEDFTDKVLKEFEINPPGKG